MQDKENQVKILSKTKSWPTETERVDSVQIQTCVLQFSLNYVEVYYVKANLEAS